MFRILELGSFRIAQVIRAVMTIAPDLMQLSKETCISISQDSIRRNKMQAKG